MLTVRDTFPEFRILSTVSVEPGKEFRTVSHTDYAGQWMVVFFWPKDYTFVCPTEIGEFGRRNADFARLNAQVLGVSIDNEYVHLNWRKSHPEIKNLPFPMVADVKRELSSALGILHKEDGVPLRATFIVDPDGIIRHVSVNDLDVGRNVEDVVRVLSALQTGELTPCNWTPGEATLAGV